MQSAFFRIELLARKHEHEVPGRERLGVAGVDHHGAPALTYPHNPNGSPDGLTAVTTPDGRFTAMMPHPERVSRNVQLSWTSGRIEDESPWLRMFRNARVWVG